MILSLVATCTSQCMASDLGFPKDGKEINFECIG